MTLTVREEVKTVKMKLEIPNFSEIVVNATQGQGIKSKYFEVGGSKFVLEIFPNGDEQAEKGMLSVFLHNESNHDVLVDYTISVEGGNTLSCENKKIYKEGGKVWKDFMRASEVGTHLEMIAEVSLKWESISGGVVQQVNSKDLVQVEERLGEKLKKMGETLEQMEQRMKTFVQGEIAKVKVTTIPECPICFLQLKPPEKIVQCLKVGVHRMDLTKQRLKMKVGYFPIKKKRMKYTPNPEGPQDL